MAGTENQCLGVAEALGVDAQIKRVGLRQPWRLLSPYLGFECAGTFTGDPLFEPWPDLLIASGRKATAAARYIKKKSAGKCFTLFLQKPTIRSKAIDLIAAPAHDKISGQNIITTIAAPNRVTPHFLADAKKAHAHIGKKLPSPRVAVLIGGNSKTHRLTEQTMRTLSKQLRFLAGYGYSLMVTASRRTGEENSKILHDSLKGLDNIYFWDGAGPNPYYGFLALADYIIVTEDSVSMISEAATTGKPTYLVELPGGSKKFRHLRGLLKRKGIVRIFSGTLEKYKYEPLNDAAMIAEDLKKRLKIK